MGQPSRILEVTPTVAANAHVAGDALGGRLDFTGALRESGNGGVLQTVVITHLSTNTFEVDIFFFDDEFQATADDTAFGPTDADITGKCIGTVTVLATDFKTTANQAVGTANAQGMVIEVKNAPGTLFAQMVTRTGFTPAAITVKLGFLKD
jgi:hypothetical protein